MWLSSKLESLFSFHVEDLRELKAELAVSRAENVLLRTQLATAQANFEWIRSRVNALEYERSGLMQKAYNISLPAPEIVRTEKDIKGFEPSSLFDSIPEDIAEELSHANARLGI